MPTLVRVYPPPRGEFCLGFDRLRLPIRSRGIGRKLSIAPEEGTDCRTGARWGTRGQTSRTMCGILALVSLGATIDCLLGAEGGRGQGGEGKHARRADSMPEEVRKLFPVLRLSVHALANARKCPRSRTRTNARACARAAHTHMYVYLHIQADSQHPLAHHPCSRPLSLLSLTRHLCALASHTL